MKRPLFILAASAVTIAFGACNKHSWDEEINGQIPTKKLFEEHGGHGDDAGHDDKAHADNHDPTHPDKASDEAAKH